MELLGLFFIGVPVSVLVFYGLVRFMIHSEKDKE